jgi:Domain of unknown function (DUF4258)
MTQGSGESSEVIGLIRKHAAGSQFRVSQHAQQEMAEESISLDDLLNAISNGEILEEYPNHRRGACCLLYGKDASRRDIHVVCTMGRPLLIIITVYLPKPPKWISPTQRSQK